MDNNENSFIRVLIGDRRPTSNELEKIKKYQQRQLSMGQFIRAKLRFGKEKTDIF